MDLKQKYTEAVETLKFDVYFIEELSIYDEEIQESVLTQLINGEEELRELNGLTQWVGGVVKREEPFFFEIEYLKQEGEKAIYLDIVQIELDDYLDLITQNKSFKSNDTTRTTRGQVNGDS